MDKVDSNVCRPLREWFLSEKCSDAKSPKISYMLKFPRCEWPHEARMS